MFEVRKKNVEELRHTRTHTYWRERNVHVDLFIMHYAFIFSHTPNAIEQFRFSIKYTHTQTECKISFDDFPFVIRTLFAGLSHFEFSMRAHNKFGLFFCAFSLLFFVMLGFVLSNAQSQSRHIVWIKFIAFLLRTHTWFHVIDSFFFHFSF